MCNKKARLPAKLPTREASASETTANLEWDARQRLPIFTFEVQRVPAWQGRPRHPAVRIREHRIADAPLHSGKYGRGVEHDTLMFVGNVRV
jgi:hypothetical protein